MLLDVDQYAQHPLFVIGQRYRSHPRFLNPSWQARRRLDDFCEFAPSRAS
jgi:hypothetical protein